MLENRLRSLKMREMSDAFKLHYVGLFRNEFPEAPQEVSA